MKIIILLSFLTSTLLSFGQNDSNYYINNTSSQILMDSYEPNYEIDDTCSLKIDTLKQIFRKDTFDLYNYYSYGKLIRISRYLKGKINAVDSYKKGKAHGNSYYFYKNGMLSNLTVYNEGNLISWIDFFENGSLKGMRINDSITGINEYEEYYDTGELLRHTVTDLNKGGIIHDISYHKNGKISSDMILGAGKQRTLTYNDKGLVVEDYSFIDLNFMFVGECKFYNWDTGKIMEHRFYKDGETREEANIRIGTWKYWNEKGELIKEEKYENGELVDTKEYLPMKIKNN